MDQEVKPVIKDSLASMVFQVKSDCRVPMGLEASLELAVCLVAKEELAFLVTTDQLALQVIAVFTVPMVKLVSLVKRESAAARVQLARGLRSFPTLKCLKYRLKKVHQVILDLEVSLVNPVHLAPWVRLEPLVKREIPVQMEMSVLLVQSVMKVRKVPKVN